MISISLCGYLVCMLAGRWACLVTWGGAFKMGAIKMVAAALAPWCLGGTEKRADWRVDTRTTSKRILSV